MKTSAILLLGGTGVRFNSELPKQFHRIAGKRVYRYALDRLRSEVDEILLAVHPDWLDWLRCDLQDPAIRIIPGGKTRQESSFLAIQQASHPIVLIHDGVRPFITQLMIQKSIALAALHGAVDTAIPSHDTLILTRNRKTIDAIPKRAHFFRGQTPQTFQKELILRAHYKALQQGKKEATDDCQLILDLQRPVHIIEGHESNIKITTELDLLLAEEIVRRRSTPLFPTTSLKGKTYLIIGGTGGIGQALSSHLQALGAKALIASPSSQTLALDLSKLETIEPFFKQIHEEHGFLDGLINAAGLLQMGPLQTLTPAEISNMITINFEGLVLACKFAKIKPGGHLINFSSSSYTRGRKNYAIYSASKAAVVNFSQALAEERPEISIHVIAPQRCDTPMRRRHFGPEENLLSPEIVAKKTVDVLRDTASTGTVIPIRVDHLEAPLPGETIEKKKRLRDTAS